jgi:quinol-cytochrome oxidoreductase complex cytochrome b subunit
MSSRDRRANGGLLTYLLDRVGIQGFISRPQEGRISARGALEAAFTKPIPHTSWWSCFGGIAFFLFLIQAVTGLLLMFFYIPADPEAHRTILYLSGLAPFGWFFRTTHHWAGIGMMLVISIHVLRVFVKGAYQRPRDLNWILGCVLFFLTAGFILTGDLLPWTRSAYWSAVWWTDLVGNFPVVGHQIMFFLRGGENITGSTITRFYVFHVFLLPTFTTLLMIVHFAIARKLGISEPL